MSVRVDLTAICEEYYGSRHYLFRILDHNSLSLPLDFKGGEEIAFPPRMAGAKPDEAALRRRWATTSPI